MWRSGTAVDCKRYGCGCKSIIYSLFSFLHSGNKTKRGVEFRHSTQYLESWAVRRERIVFTLNSFCYPAFCGIQREAKSMFKFRCVKHLQLFSLWPIGTKCDENRLVMDSIPTRGFKYLLKCIFSFLRYGVEAKRGVEFRYSTRNTSRTRRKMGNGVS